MLAELWIWTDAIAIIVLVAVVGVYVFFSFMHLLTGRLYRKYKHGELLKEHH